MVEAVEVEVEAAQSRVRAAEAELDFLADARQVGTRTRMCGGADVCGIGQVGTRTQMCGGVVWARRAVWQRAGVRPRVVMR